MGTQIRLRGVSFGNASLPALSSFGDIAVDGLAAMYDFKSEDDYLSDKSGNGNDLVPTSGAGDWSYSDGILTAGGGASGYNTGHFKDGLNFTGVVAMQIPSTNNFYAFRLDGLVGVNQRINAGGESSAYYANADGSARFADGGVIATKSPGDYALFACATDGTNIYLSVDGAAWGASAIQSGPQIIPNGTQELLLGSTATNAGAFVGGVGFAAYWDRKLSDLEIQRVYQSVRGIMSAKGRSI